MFEVGFTEIILILGIALLVLGPEKLPKLASQIGRWAGRARAMARQLRQQLDDEVSLSASTPPDPPVRRLLAANFTGWTDAVEACLADAGARIPRGITRKQLASFVLTTMEGGVMQARTHRGIEPFDAAVADGELLDDAKRQGVSVEPMSGAAVQDLVSSIVRTPDAVVSAAGRWMTLK